MCENFCVKNFRAEIFSWSGPTTKLFYQRKFIHVKLRKWRIIERALLAAFTCIATSGRRILGKCSTAKENQETLKTGTPP